MADTATFPFGRPSTPRPPRRPTRAAALFVVGVYPSALHVRWSPPAWARDELGIGTIGALAVDDEPTVFWDGADARDRIQSWKDAVEFRDGDDRDCWGRVAAVGNGTSGRSVLNRVLHPLGIEPEATWFTDVVDRYFVKSNSGQRREQGDAIAADYTPFASAAGLPAARLPARPSVEELVALAVEDHTARLRAELLEAAAPVVITLGEEARRVLAAIADAVSGPPTDTLDGRRLSGSAGAKYGLAGVTRIDTHEMTWHALVHPGQRGSAWVALHDGWIARQAQ